jgi:hypothetical protein
MLLSIWWRKDYKVSIELGSCAFVGWSALICSNILFMLNFIGIEVGLNLVVGCLIHMVVVVDCSGNHYLF